MRIVTVYYGGKAPFDRNLSEMSFIRWLKVSQSLARLGYSVDIAVDEPGFFRRRFPLRLEKNLRRVPLARVRWSEYDVVKALFHFGFETLERFGGASHPYIISKLGSVVGSRDLDGVYFHGEVRSRLFELQERIRRGSRYVTALTEPSRSLWASCFGDGGNLLCVPGAADREIPPPGRDPFPRNGKIRCLFAGHVYSENSQKEAHLRLIETLNTLGGLLRRRGAQLYAMGSGDVRALDPRRVVHLGRVPYGKSWQHLYHAHVGLVPALGSHPNHNESSKIYHYLRAGLPTVCESGFPNQALIEEARLGFIVPNGDREQLADKLVEAASRPWDREAARRMILARHTWDHRAEVYHRLIQRDFGRSS